MDTDPDSADATIQTAKAIFAAFVAKDRSAAEKLIADKFSFTSPIDNALDRKAYFSICWPHSESMQSVEFCGVCKAGNCVFVTYEAQMSNGKRIRNTEILTINGGKISAVEVYFGWNVPHEIPPGEHRDP